MAEGGAGPFVFKIMLIGDGSVGKTTYVKKLQFGNFEKGYEATNGFTVYPLLFNTTSGEIKFEVYDTSGQETIGRLNRETYDGAHGGIVVYDVTSMISYKNVPNWCNNLEEMCNGIPIVIAGNKVDLKNRKVKLKSITYRPDAHVQMSAKDNTNIDKPFIMLARKLVKDENLHLVETAAFLPPSVSLTTQERKKIQRDVELAQLARLPEDDDDL